MSQLIITRKEAKERGAKRYFTGKPCKHGHVAERLTTSSTCLTCKQKQEAVRYETTGGVDHRRQYQDNREAKLAFQKQYNEDNRDKIAQYQSGWRSRNVEYIQKYRKDNASLYAYHRAQRRARQIQATVAWGDPVKIQELYDQAPALTVETGVKHHVDHVIPLKHPLVCGLHVESNIQVLTETENLKKHNCYQP